MSTSLLSRAKTVAFQGEPGAYANLAAREALPHASAIPRPTFDAALDAVRKGETDLAIVPVENSVYGRIADTHLLVRHFGRPVKGHASTEKNDLFIAGEHFHRVRHQLLGLKGTTLADVKEVYSQRPALGQCQKIIKELGLIEREWYDTAGSAKHVAEMGDPKCAAIAAGSFRILVQQGCPPQSAQDSFHQALLAADEVDARELPAIQRAQEAVGR